MLQKLSALFLFAALAGAATAQVRPACCFKDTVPCCLIKRECCPKPIKAKTIAKQKEKRPCPTDPGAFMYDGKPKTISQLERCCDKDRYGRRPQCCRK